CRRWSQHGASPPGIAQGLAGFRSLPRGRLLAPSARSCDPGTRADERYCDINSHKTIFGLQEISSAACPERWASSMRLIFIFPPRVSRDPIDFPRLPAIVGECLFEATGIGSDV